MIELQWDSNALKLLENFQNSKSYWQDFLQRLYEDINVKAKGYIEDEGLVKARAVWNGATHGTGALENSLGFKVQTRKDGFTMQLMGLWYGNYMDIGNFPAGAVISRQGGKGFPVGKRGGEDSSSWTWSNTIHGMGYRTPDVPTHFSEKTAQWLSDNMHEFADSYMQELLDRLVNV